MKRYIPSQKSAELHTVSQFYTDKNRKDDGRMCVYTCTHIFMVQWYRRQAIPKENTLAHKLRQKHTQLWFYCIPFSTRILQWFLKKSRGKAKRKEKTGTKANYFNWKGSKHFSSSLPKTIFLLHTNPNWEYKEDISIVQNTAHRGILEYNVSLCVIL